VAGTLGEWGFARIGGTSHVHAKVSMHGLDPNTTYLVRFIQGIPACGVTNATFTTDARGRSHASMSEPAASRGSPGTVGERISGRAGS
jgi:lipoate-protein ligase B